MHQQIKIIITDGSANDDKAKAKELEESGEVDDADDYKAIFEGLELGTEATRSGIIDNAKKSGFLVKIHSFCFNFVQNNQILHIVIKHFYENDIDKEKKKYYN